MASGNAGLKVSSSASSSRTNFAPTPKTLLFSFPIIVDLTTRLLDPKEISSLWNTGCRTLQQAMSYGGVTIYEMDSKISLNRKWPSLVYQFHQLSTLIIKIPLQNGFSGLDVKLLPPSITKVHFEFSQAESCFFLEAPNNRFVPGEMEPKMMDIKLIFPKIQSIHLAGALYVSKEFISNFPKETIRFISVRTMDKFGDPKTKSFFSKEGLESLPPNLTSLSLRGCLAWTTNDFLILPSRLTSLHLSGVYPLESDCFEALPHSLESLELEAFDNVEILENSFFLCLPKNLLSLKLRSRSKILSQCFHLLPVMLEHLEISSTHLSINTEDVQGLPRKIKFLSFSECRFMHLMTDFGDLPPNLLSLVFSFKDMSGRNPYPVDVNDPNISKTLPRTLTHLELLNSHLGEAFFQDDFLEGLPDNLKFLRIPRNACGGDNMVQLLARLPLTFLDMGSTSIPPNLIKNLPRTLTYINMAEWWIPMSKTVTSALPRGITKLTLIYSDGIDDDAIKALPPHLTYLELRNCPKLSPKCFALLPRRLKTLILHGLDRIHPDTVDRSPLPPNISYIELRNSLVERAARNSNARPQVSQGVDITAAYRDDTGGIALMNLGSF